MKENTKRQLPRPLELEEPKSPGARNSQSVRPLGRAQLRPVPSGRSPGLWLSLQRTLGNQAVGRLLPGRDGQEPPRTAMRVQRRLSTHGSHEVSSRIGPIQQPVEAGTIQRRDGRRRRRANTGTVTIQNVRFQYYNVTGQTLADVLQQLDPTEWGRCSYHYSYTYSASNGQTTRVNITLRLTIRLPRWTGRGWRNASPAAKAEWRRMVRALRTHEDGHAAIARRWAPTFKQRMLNQSEEDLEDTFNQVLGEVDDEQEQFDDRTQHGQTQGVSLDTSIQ